MDCVRLVPVAPELAVAVAAQRFNFPPIRGVLVTLCYGVPEGLNKSSNFLCPISREGYSLCSANGGRHQQRVK